MCYVDIRVIIVVRSVMVIVHRCCGARRRVHFIF